MENQGRGIKVEVKGSRSGSRLGVKVGGEVKVLGGRGCCQGRGSRSREGSWLGVKVLGGVKVWGVKVVVKVGGQGRGVKVRGMIGGHKVGVSVRVQSRGGGVQWQGVNVWERGHGQGDEGQGLLGELGLDCRFGLLWGEVGDK